MLEISPAATESVIVNQQEVFYYIVWQQGGSPSNLIASKQDRLSHYADDIERKSLCLHNAKVFRTKITNIPGTLMKSPISKSSPAPVICLIEMQFRTARTTSGGWRECCVPSGQVSTRRWTFMVMVWLDLMRRPGHHHDRLGH